MLAAETYSSLGALLSDALVQWKRETALIEIDRKKVKRELTYRDCMPEVARVASFLSKTLPTHTQREASALSPSSPRVAVLLGNQSRWLLSACAIFRVGATLVPIDYKLSAQEQLELIAHAKADLLVTELPLSRRFAALPSCPVLLVDGTESKANLYAWDELPDAEMPPLAERAREDVATIVYSSGTSGRAKGCLLTHGAYLAQLDALMAIFPMRPGHRTFSILPTNHAIDFMVGFIGPFASGATVVHQRTLRPEFLISTLEDHAITHMAVVPVLLEAFERAIDERLEKRPSWQRKAFSLLTTVNQALTRDAVRPELSRKLLPSVHEAFGGKLELIFAGGAFVDRERAERFHAMGLPVVIGYGLTECCTVATVNDLRPFRANSVGAPVKGVELRIVNASEDGVGEVWVRGETLMRGYLDEPELTEAALTSDGWLRTGDLGRLDASRHLQLVGRSKNMIVTPGGKNIYPEDVEGVFAGIQDVKELAVFATGYVWPMRESLVTEGLCAIVRGDVERTQLAKELELRNRKLPEHKRIASFLVTDEEFPRTASMKVKREVLAAWLREHARPSELVRLRVAEKAEGALSL
jgi:long-chain acyl-CoA synthetase